MARFIPRDTKHWSLTVDEDQIMERLASETERPEETEERSRDLKSADLQVAEQLEVTRQERDQYLAIARHAQSELENFRRRSHREYGLLEQRALARLIIELVPVLDHFQMAISQKPADDPAGVFDGIMLIYRELLKVIERLGVEPIAPDPGAAFDPVQHEAMMTQGTGDVNAGRVASLITQGYRVGEQVLRPARVVVAS